MNERFVLITGASRGFGKVLSWRFAKEGYGLCLVAQEEKCLNELSIELKQQFKNEIQSNADTYVYHDFNDCIQDLYINKSEIKFSTILSLL